jgi:hypothetical protein
MLESCEFLVDLEPGWICIPLQGTMKAVFVGSESDRAAVETFLAVHVAAVVNNSSDFLGIGVNETVFVGSRVIPSPAPIVDESVSRGVDDSSSNEYSVALASSLSVAAVFLMFVLYFALARRRRSRLDNDEEAEGTNMEKEVVIGADVRNDVLPPAVQCTPTKSIDSKSNSSEEKSDEARCGNIELSNRLGREVIDPTSAGTTSPYPITAAYALTNIRTASTVVSTDESEMNTPDDDESGSITTVASESKIVVATSEPPSMTDTLPPKHPTGPSSKLSVPPTSAAKLPKGRRRRKKKKKKPTIVRSNSRENINEMETITEGEEETSGDNQNEASDEGSWCSTSDSEPGSRDPSPARSSRNSSREPSPARSTGSGNNDCDSNDAVGEGTMDNTKSIGPSADATFGTEKPRQNRLPPSWF